jgi:hypothetical protein
MGLIRKLFGGGNNINIEEEIERKGFSTSDCSFDCDSCSSKFPASVSVEEKDELWNSTKEYGLHIVVASGKTDWPHDACLVPGTVGKAVSGWADLSNDKFPELGTSSSIKVTMSSLCSAELDTNEEYILGRRGDILILPFFIWIKNVSAENVGSLLDVMMPKLIESRDKKIPPPSKVENFDDVTVQADGFQSYIFLCSHRTRDKRCGVTAPLMKREMEIYLRDLGLYRDFNDYRPNGVRVAYINHVGGHKYVANVLMYSKTGKNIWLARCRPQNVRPIIDECILADGKVWADKVRIIQRFDPIEW